MQTKSTASSFITLKTCRRVIILIDVQIRIIDSVVFNGCWSILAQVYLPQDTPAGLKGLRDQELINMRGKGSGLRKEAYRIYDYDVYNDLGDSDQHESLKWPMLGRNDKFPYPRCMRTRRPPSEIGTYDTP